MPSQPSGARPYARGMSDNPFLAPSTLPYQLPDFASIRFEHLAPAFEAGLAEQRAEVAAIVADPAPVSFANTIEALERSGQVLGRVSRVFFNASSADATPETDALEAELAPRLAAHDDGIRLDSALYERIRTVPTEGLDAEQAYLLERWTTRLGIAGAELDETAKVRLRELNGALAELTTRFEKQLLADTNELAVVFDTAEELDGLSPAELGAAASAASDRGLDGKWLVTLVLFTGHPFLASLTNRESRRRIMEASRARGSRGGAHDNRATVLEIVRLRAERAELLGYPSHAAWVTADRTAGSPEAVDAMLRRLAPAAAANAAAEHAELEAIAGHPVEAHDWKLYAERVRAERFQADAAALRPYFEAERVLQEGVFRAAHLLYGLDFAERTDLVGYRPEVRVFEVTERGGEAVGLFLLDLYTRDSKRGGAWMNSLARWNRLLDEPVVVTNNLNVPRPPVGSPTLLTYDELTTLFHEFGHALHGLLARVTYPSAAGTSVHRDFVEFPSQVNEMWALEPAILEAYAVHYETGERMPAELVERLRAAERYGQGFATSEYLAAAILDQAWHRLSRDEADAVTDVAAFEAAALEAAGLAHPSVPTRYSSTYFAHTFSGGYDAGYYGYIWSEVLDADTVEWFAEHGGLTRDNGDRFRAQLLGVGGSKDPLEAYRDFRGRDARIEPLLERRGLA